MLFNCMQRMVVLHGMEEKCKKRKWILVLLKLQSILRIYLFPLTTMQHKWKVIEIPSICQ